MGSFIFIVVLVLCLSSCTHTETLNVLQQKVVISGNLIDTDTMSYFRDTHETDHEYAYHTRDCKSRNTSSCLKEGDQISFYADSGIKADGQILSLRSGFWTGETALHWNEQYHSANICAFNPPIHDDVANMYDNDKRLVDILIAQGSFVTGEPINLHFEHLFTQLIFKLDPQLNNQLKGISLIPKFTVDGIDPYLGEIKAISNEGNTIITYSKHTNGTYTILIAPHTEQSIHILIETQDGKTLEKRLNLLNCKRNHSFICNVKEKEPAIGIETAEDFIAFTNLINHTAYKNRSLDEFRTTVNGVSTYYLNKDIHFTNEQKSRIRQIGLNGFNDVFDGRGHTLSNIGMKEEQTKNPGLFPEIQGHGVVRNLHITECTTEFLKKGSCTGIICGVNRGNIINCSIQNCEIRLHKKEAGGIAGRNFNTIINCQVNGLKIIFDKEVDTTGDIACGISSINGTNGNILNCQVKNLDATGGNISKLGLSCFVHQNSGRISNCVSDGRINKFHPFCKNCNSPCDHCYYPLELNYSPGKGEMSQSEQTKHSITTFSRDINSRLQTIDKLNTWIESVGSKQYSNVNFSQWKLSENNSFTF